MIVILLLFHLFMVIGAFFAGCWAMHCGRSGTSPIPPAPTLFKRAEVNGEQQAEPPRHPRASIPSRVGN